MIMTRPGNVELVGAEELIVMTVTRTDDGNDDEDGS